MSALPIMFIDNQDVLQKLSFFSQENVNKGIMLKSQNYEMHIRTPGLKCNNQNPSKCKIIHTEFSSLYTCKYLNIALH